MSPKKNKKYYFLAGLPRAGNTLLGSLLNQNPDIRCTANSIIYDIFYSLINIKGIQKFRNFPLHSSLNNVVHNVFENYYSNWDYKYIIDRGLWGYKDSFNILRYKFGEDVRIVLLVRPVLEIIASFVRITKPKDLEKYCEDLMSPDKAPGGSIIHYSIESAQNLLKQDKKYYTIIHYDDLVNDTEDTLNKIYDFLNIPRFKHRLNNLEQLTFEDVKYDDTVLPHGPIHTIKTNEIKKDIYKVSDYLTPSIIKKYEDRGIHI